MGHSFQLVVGDLLYAPYDRQDKRGINPMAHIMSRWSATEPCPTSKYYKEIPIRTILKCGHAVFDSPAKITADNPLVHDIGKQKKQQPTYPDW